MHSRVMFSLSAILLSGALIGSAAAQTPDQPAAQNGGSGGWVQVPSGNGASPYDTSGVTPGSATAPERLSDGTLAESAATTALASATYHQPTGFLPGMKP